MNWLRRNPLFAFVLLLSAGALAWEGWALHGTWERTQRAERTLRQRQAERDWLAHRKPALSAENSEAIAADVAAAERRLGELRQALRGRGRWLPAAPKRSLDAYFALASFTEKARALAVRQQVELRADERFGFATHASVGPGPEQLAAVHRQRVLIEHLVESLLEARPRSLLAVQRERPRIATPLAGANAAASAASESRAREVATDFFEPDAQVRLRMPGLVDTEAFRLEFTGQTQSLRAFLNGLASAKLPLIVRAIEVEPLAPETATASAAAGAPVPLVTQNFSKFAVVVEFVELPPAPDPAEST